MGNKPRLLRNFQYPLAKGVLALIRLMPYRMALSTGRSLALVAWAADPFHRKAARIQMRHALGDACSPALERKVFMFHGDILVDAVKFSFMPDEEIEARVSIEGREHLDRALAADRGLMLITGHIGNWEMLAHLSRLLGVQFCVMADVREDPRLESLVNDLRLRSGATILPPKGKALMLIRELKKGSTIGFLVDQRGKRSDGVFCDFFGLPAPTNPAPAFLAVKTGALVLPVYAIKKDGRYVVSFSEARDASSFGHGKEGIANMSQYMQSWVESVVRRHPDQWFWLHCRWTRRSEMREIIRKRLDFETYVRSQAVG
ncbi:MAG TPA: lysophospholipid acyltransferase family protein [Deltaproteobacteria bacterium]|jgi:KDO2-lipid IV(A) lauroyltransferase|nr:lysophospholipid acyltransferase family protein [Deltaproteobacteria bacterium]HOI07873.1 lysophospholipid acyltransferase family protein [Deltaproteobacteria bacterium]